MRGPLLLVVISSLAWGCGRPPAVVVGQPEVDAETLVVSRDADAPFSLTDQTGAAFSSASLAGKVWLGAVFFANCPGPCFRENQAIAEILREIDDPDLMVVSLTCDPDNDTPEVLRRYAERFEADARRWKFLAGDMAEIIRVGNGRFLLPVEVGSHAEKGVVFDRHGRLRGGYSLTKAERVVLLKKLIREVLAERADDVEAAGAPTGDGT